MCFAGLNLCAGLVMRVVIWRKRESLAITQLTFMLCRFSAVVLPGAVSGSIQLLWLHQAVEGRPHR